MDLPTPLTPSQVEGSTDKNEQPVFFTSGPHAGQTLLVSGSDPNLEDAVANGEVLVQHTEAFVLPEFRISLLEPNSLPAASGGTVTVTGVNLRSGDVAMIGDKPRATTFVSATQRAFVVAPGELSAQDHGVRFHRSGDPGNATNALDLTLT